MTTHLACTSIILCFTAAPLRCARIRGVISDARERANSTLSLALVVFFFYYFSFSSSSSLSSFFLFYFLAKRTTQLFHLIRLTEFESVLKMYDNFCVPFILPPSLVCIATFRVLRCETSCTVVTTVAGATATFTVVVVVVVRICRHHLSSVTSSVRAVVVVLVFLRRESMKISFERQQRKMGEQFRLLNALLCKRNEYFVPKFYRRCWTECWLTPPELPVPPSPLPLPLPPEWRKLKLVKNDEKKHVRTKIFGDNANPHTHTNTHSCIGAVAVCVRALWHAIYAKMWKVAKEKKYGDVPNDLAIIKDNDIVTRAVRRMWCARAMCICRTNRKWNDERCAIDDESEYTKNQTQELSFIADWHFHLLATIPNSRERWNLRSRIFHLQSSRAIFGPKQNEFNQCRPQNELLFFVILMHMTKQS